MIELIGINKFFGKTLALADVNLSVPKGEIFGVIGKSGAGKSTLLRCINLLERPDSGKVIVENQSITALSKVELRTARHKIGMIFQHFNLLNSKTIFENIALPMRIQSMTSAQIEAKVSELLSLVELEHKRHSYPSKLSGGQKQRVAIARALSCSPKILLCDEATSALDPGTTEAILQLLQKINQVYGITIVLITHEMQVVKRICHRLAVMEGGKIQEVMSLVEAFAKPESQAYPLLCSQLSPKLPECVENQLSSLPSSKPILRLFFQGESAMVPFISRTSRELNLDINILLANIDRFDTITFGALIVELRADELLLSKFINECKQANLMVEVLGYVADSN